VTEIYLTKEQWARLPYKNTAITRARTYGDIIGLLEGHGIKDYRWTRYQGQDVLEFPLVVKRGDVERGFMVRLTVPKLYYTKKMGRAKNAPKKQVYLENVSWRIFWWYLKSKLEAIQYGISDEIREFMYNITYALPDGQQVTLGEAVLEHMDRLGRLEALPEEEVEYR